MGKPVGRAPKIHRSAESTEKGVIKIPKRGGQKYPCFSEVVNGGGEVLAIVARAEQNGTTPKEKWRTKNRGKIRTPSTLPR